jgi:hypothetical protein
MEIELERVVSKPYGFVEAALLDGSADWVPGMRLRDGDWTTALDIDLGSVRVARRVVVRTGPVIRHRRDCVLPLWWHGEAHPDRYPVLFGVLKLSRLAPRRTRLTLRARYDPPAGVAGELADRAVLHWVAETSVGAFLERIAGVLEREALSVGLTARLLPAVPAVSTAG